MATPIRQQYSTLKEEFPGQILLLLVGDFYEAFDEDAKTVAQVCDLVLTSRAISEGVRVPLVGLPYHSLDRHVATLNASGYVVAVAEWDGNKTFRTERNG